MYDIDLCDLGDATEETKQCAPAAFVPDSWFQWGIRENLPQWPPQCP